MRTLFSQISVLGCGIGPPGVTVFGHVTADGQRAARTNRALRNGLGLRLVDLGPSRNRRYRLRFNLNAETEYKQKARQDYRDCCDEQWWNKQEESSDAA